MTPTPRRVVERRTLPFCDLVETAYEPGTWVPPHRHGRPSVCVALEGSCTERRDGVRREHRALSVTLNVGGGSHAFRIHDTGLRCFSVSVNEEWLATRWASGPAGCARPVTSPKARGPRGSPRPWTYSGTSVAAPIR